MSGAKAIRIGFVGLGVVGQGVWKHLQRSGDALAARIGAPFELGMVAVRDKRKKRGVDIPVDRLTDDPMAVARDPSTDILCELMGGTGQALEVVVEALRNRKTVVTANKALLCEHGAELFKVARENGVDIYFEASVAGGIPIIKALREGLVANRFELIYGILNGTCNYILTRMEREQKTFEDIVGDARRLGYVEADESLDLDGWDAAHKAAILAWLAHGRWISMTEMPVEGIRGVTLEDLRWARELGYRVKLLAVIRHNAAENTVFASVMPTLIPLDQIVAGIDGVYNAVSVHGDVVGESIYIGRGAGQDATASAVISDLVDAAYDRIHRLSPLPAPDPAQVPALAPLERMERPFYLRLKVRDAAGVLADVATIMARHQISIASVLQEPAADAGLANLVLTTHITNERCLRDAVTDLKAHAEVAAEPLVLRIANLRKS